MIKVNLTFFASQLMEKYHIYEELGKGRFAQVFKGRERRSVEYVAIKRVDKSRMAHVSSESLPARAVHSFVACCRS